MTKESPLIDSYRNFRLVTVILGVLIPISLVAIFGEHIGFVILGSTVTSAALLPWLVKRSGMWERKKDLNPLANPEIQHTIARFARYGLPFML